MISSLGDYIAHFNFQNSNFFFKKKQLTYYILS